MDKDSPATRCISRRALFGAGAGLAAPAVLGLRTGTPGAASHALQKPGIGHRPNDAGCACPVCTTTLPADAQMV